MIRVFHLQHSKGFLFLFLTKLLSVTNKKKMSQPTLTQGQEGAEGTDTVMGQV